MEIVFFSLKIFSSLESKLTLTGINCCNWFPTLGKFVVRKILFPCFSIEKLYAFMTTLKKYIPHGTSIIWRISLREKFPFLELFWSVFSRIRTEYE